MIFKKIIFTKTANNLENKRPRREVAQIDDEDQENVGNIILLPTVHQNKPLCNTFYFHNRSEQRTRGTEQRSTRFG